MDTSDASDVYQCIVSDKPLNYDVRLCSVGIELIFFIDTEKLIRNNEPYFTARGQKMRSMDHFWLQLKIPDDPILSYELSQNGGNIITGATFIQNGSYACSGIPIASDRSHNAIKIPMRFQNIHSADKPRDIMIEQHSTIHLLMNIDFGSLNQKPYLSLLLHERGEAKSRFSLLPIDMIHEINRWLTLEQPRLNICDGISLGANITSVWV